jgi:hypothetical protein
MQTRADIRGILPVSEDVYNPPPPWRSAAVSAFVVLAHSSEEVVR